MLALDLYVSDGSTAWRPAGALKAAPRDCWKSETTEIAFYATSTFPVFSQLRKDERIML
jgi:hypothetical protein